MVVRDIRDMGGEFAVFHSHPDVPCVLPEVEAEKDVLHGYGPLRVSVVFPMSQSFDWDSSSKRPPL